MTRRKFLRSESLRMESMAFNTELKIGHLNDLKIKNDQIGYLQNDLLKSKRHEVKLMDELSILRRPRDEKGHYLKTTGKGHGKKKETTATPIRRTKERVIQAQKGEITELQQGQILGRSHRKERDWTKATESELLAEAKRRYPVGTRIKCLHGTGIDCIDTDNFEIWDDDLYCMRHRCLNELVNCVYMNGQWAKIIPSC